MKATYLPLLSLLPLGFLTSCNQPPLAPAAPALATPGAATNPYGVPQANPYGVPGATPNAAYTPEAVAPYQPVQPINPPAAVAPYTPTPAPIPTYNQAPTAGGRSHTIVKGESLWGISRKYGVTVDQLRQANSMTGDTIIEGRSLTIPGQ